MTPKTFSENKEKKLFLTDEERNNIIGRHKFIEYLLDLIKKDITLYLREVVCARLGVSDKSFVTLSEDCSYLTIGEEKKIIVPDKGIVLPKGVKKNLGEN